jgi:hypothetical protein
MTDQPRPARHELSDLHAYIVPISPKVLRETLGVVGAALTVLEEQHPRFNAGGSIATHRERLALLDAEAHRMRPTGPDGKHGDRHTPECGCIDKAAVARVVNR